VFTKTPNPDCILQSAATKTATYTFTVINNCPDPLTNAVIIDQSLGITYNFAAPIPAGQTGTYITPPQTINVTRSNNAVLSGSAGATAISLTASAVVRVLADCSCACGPTCPHGNSGAVMWHTCHLYDGLTNHWAIDYSWPGTVVATGCGIVHIFYSGDCSLPYIHLNSDDGHYMFQYLHLDSATIAVTEGQHVCTGERLASVFNGSDLPCSTGTHLHYGVQHDGIWVDPNGYVGVCYTSDYDPCDNNPAKCNAAGC
jgi:hypothetical protein